MNFLIEIYDNSLIYYPNLFFPILFLLSILGIVLLVRLIIFLSKESKGIARGIKINLSKIKIKKRERVKFSTSKLTDNIFYAVKSTRNFIIKINNTLRNIRQKIEKIMMRIKREVLID